MLYHTNSHGPDIDALKRALAKCIELSASSNYECKICVHTKGQFNSNTFIEAFGEEFVKALLTGTVKLGSIIFYLETEQKKLNSPMAAIAPFVNLDYLRDIISRNSNSNVVYVPRREDELEDYELVVNSTVI